MKTDGHVTYTNEQIRGAILRAADRIEARPDLWAWKNIDVPPCGSPGCAVGHIGAALGVTHDVFGFKLCGDLIAGGTARFYTRMCELGCPLSDSQSLAKIPAGLRAYADKYFPATIAAPVDPSHALIPWSECVFQPAALRDVA